MSSDIVDLIRQIKVLRDEMAMFSEREKVIKQRIVDYVKSHGLADAKGSLSCDIDDDISGVARVVWQRRVSKSLNADAAEELLTNKDLLDKCTAYVAVLDEEEIMKAYYEDQLTEEDIDTMFPSKENWALVMPKL
jgi:hypothetical protein